MNNNKVIKIIWISGIYIFLFLVLFLIIEYKIRWEGRDLSNYLYFYNCSDNLCTTELKQKEYYSKFKCKSDCPRIKNIISDNLVILEGINYGAIYDYQNGDIIDDSYIEYNLSCNNKIIVSNGIYKGVIDYDGNILLSLYYDNILDCYSDYVTIYNDNLWGIKNIIEGYGIEPKYDSIKIINKDILLVSLNNLYYFVNYSDEIKGNKYNYLYYIDNYIIAINDNKIDFLNTNLDSKLIMKINTVYEYNNEIERNSLNIRSDSEYIYLNVYNGSEYIMYKYSKERNTISY